MKYITVIFCVYLVCTNLLIAQTQHRIEWPSLADSPWPVLNGDMQGTGRSEFVGPTSSNPYIHWMADLPLGIFWGPTIGYDNILYFGSFALDPDFENHFYAYYPDGTPYWIVNTSSGTPNISSALITSDSTVYMATNADTLYALSVDGIVKWKTSIGFGERKMHFSIDRTGNIYTINSDTLRIINKQGNTLLTKHYDDISSPVIFSPDGSTIYFKTGHHTSWEEDHSLIAADLQGNIDWRYWFFETNEAPVTVDNQGNIYLYGSDSTDGHDDFIYSLDNNGDVRWKYPTDGFLSFNSVTVDPEGNIVFYCRKENGNRNYIVSVKNDGEVNWEVQLEPDKDPLYSQVDHGLVSDAEGNIYFGTENEGHFYAMNEQGEFLWDLSLNGYSYYSSPAIGSNGTLYIGTSISTFFQNHQQNLIAVNDEPVFVEVKTIPKKNFQLEQNYPNPFNPSTKIEYSVEKPEWIKLDVYNFLGEYITTLVDEYKNSGSYTVRFSGEGLSSGVYFYTIRSSNLSVGSQKSFSQTGKMILLK